MLIENRTSCLRLAIELISDKWRIAILHELSAGPRRTAALQRALPNVAPKVLTQTLRGLERDGLVQRKAYPAAPPRVDYRLTEMARTLLNALDQVCRWAEEYGPETAVARNRYDTQAEARANMQDIAPRMTSDSGQIGRILQARFGARPPGGTVAVARAGQVPPV